VPAMICPGSRTKGITREIRSRTVIRCRQCGTERPKLGTDEIMPQHTIGDRPDPYPGE
jgi:hypothetical protein